MKGKPMQEFKINVPTKEPPPWKFGKTKEGDPIFLPTRMRIKPNKYSPKAGHVPKHSPHCLGKGLKSDQIIKCRSCLWENLCK